MKNQNNKNEQLKELINESEGQLTIDVYQTPEEIVIESTIAGVEVENLDVEITPELVNIRGERQRQECVPEEDYLYQECYWGRFSRSVILPQEIDPDKSSAELNNGVLKIVLPKINRAKTKKLKIKSSNL